MINSRKLLCLVTFGLVVAAGACSSIKKATTPTGKTWPDSDSLAIEKARNDSLAALERAREDSINRARALDDSLRVAREAEQRSAVQLSDSRAIIEATIYFDYDQSALTDAACEALDAKATVLRANTGIRVRITGHTDECGADEYNLALGLRRAAEVKQYLAANGVGSNRLETVSMGEEVPAVPGDVEESYARNRRAEFVIITGDLEGGTE